MNECKESLPGKRKKTSFLLPLFCGVLLGVSVTFLAGILFLRHSLLPEYECGGSFEETIEKFTGTVAKNPAWTLRKVQCGMPAMGEGERVSVFELCNGKYASKLLKDPESRKSSAMIPCKVAIYEKEGKVILSRLNLTLFFLLVGGYSSEVFREEIVPEQKVFLYSAVKK